MADHTDNALRAAIKALDEVVAPAVDPANPLAGEQLRLVSRFLGFLRLRTQYQDDRERFELAHYLALARSLLPHAASVQTLAATIAQRIDAGEMVLARGDATVAHRRAAVDALTASISILIRSSASFDAVELNAVERKVVAASKALFDVQRAFYLPMGFEPDPQRVPTLEAALAAPHSTV